MIVNNGNPYKEAPPGGVNQHKRELGNCQKTFSMGPKLTSTVQNSRLCSKTLNHHSIFLRTSNFGVKAACS